MPTIAPMITGVDFVAVPTRDLATAMSFYGETLGMPRSMHIEGKPFAEFETGSLTLSIIEPDKMGLEHALNRNHIALHVDDVASARSELEARGVIFEGEILDTGVCHMAFFADPDGNALMLHHRYAPRETQA
jgi:catechol 2,3-dioxygenase-like lactoylglutathione lyase family enzyme